MRSEKTVAVIGAGAAGLAAAIEIMRTPGAVGNGVKVILIEKLDRVGKKILSTGNGRCNLSNINASADGYFGGRTLVDAAFKRFSPEETLRFFQVDRTAVQRRRVRTRISCQQYGVVRTRHAAA